MVGAQHVLTGDATAGTRSTGPAGSGAATPAVICGPADTAEVAAVLACAPGPGCRSSRRAATPGWSAAACPLHGEVVLSLARLDRARAGRPGRRARSPRGPGVTLAQVGGRRARTWTWPSCIASRDSATVGGAIATNAGGLRVLRYGPMRAQLRGVEAVLSDGTVVSHLSGLVKDNTGYDYPALLAGSEGTLAVITQAAAAARAAAARPGHRAVALDSPAAAHSLAVRALTEVPGLLSAEFLTQPGLDLLVEHAGLRRALAAAGPGLPAAGGGRPGRARRPGRAGRGPGPPRWRSRPADRARLWAYRERHPEAAGFLGTPIKLDVSVPAARWERLATTVAGVVTAADPGAHGARLRPRRRRKPARQHRPGRPGRTDGTRTRYSGFVA